MAGWDWFGRLHRYVYEKTDGRIGANLAGRHMLLLTTTGRKSGRQYTTPLACFADGDNLIVVASNNGQDHHPAWWLNLEHTPDASVRYGREQRRVRAETANGDERIRLWPWLVTQNPPYARYEKRTAREIPIVILRKLN
jgi:deazaflavin-dependent oxidoreductase (nitroreductase family)